MRVNPFDHIREKSRLLYYTTGFALLGGVWGSIWWR